jgi:hypothetical protein
MLGCRKMPHLATWYRREDYDLILTIMDDASEFPETFEERERMALRQVASMRNRGADVKQVVIDPDKFVIFCEKRGLSKDGTARAEYAASTVTATKRPIEESVDNENKSNFSNYALTGDLRGPEKSSRKSSEKKQHPQGAS